MASMGIFGDPVTPMQYFGYSIALGGLVYYRLGGEKMQHAVADAKLTFGSLQQNHPGKVRAALFVTVFAVAGLALLFWWPRLTHGIV